MTTPRRVGPIQCARAYCADSEVLQRFMVEIESELDKRTGRGACRRESEPHLEFRSNALLAIGIGDTPSTPREIFSLAERCG